MKLKPSLQPVVVHFVEQEKLLWVRLDQFDHCSADGTGFGQTVWRFGKTGRPQIGGNTTQYSTRDMR